MIRKELQNIIEISLKELQKEKALPVFDIKSVNIETPENSFNGDYSTNIAMILAKESQKSPREIAELIKNKCQNSKFIKKIETAGPGFLNFFISKEFLEKEIGKILKKQKDFGKLNENKKSISIEFICANPTGELHIGHGRGAFFGETLANVFEKAGFKVSRIHYANDSKASSQIKALGETALGEGTTYLNPYLEEKINSLKSKLKNCKNERDAGSLLAKEVQKDIKNFIRKKLNIKFDKWVSEEDDLYKTGEIDKVYDWLQKNDLIYEKDGAKWLKTSKYEDTKDWVLVRETGAFTYLMPDIVYHKTRFDKKYNKIIDIWGADHQGHIQKIKAVAKMLGYKGEMIFLISQVVRLKGEKMSKRKGKTITLDWLIREVGLDAVRFFYLMKSLDTHMDFDTDLAKEQSSKNPVYYVQYAYARICSILRKSNPSKDKNISLVEESEKELAKQLIRLPEVIEDTALDYQIQRLPKYAMELAESFHRFYQKCQVISEDKGLTGKRLSLVLATKIVLKKTLDLMGISTPEKM
ncbi:MAG: arginine--tRNA ligase [bacterium]